MGVYKDPYKTWISWDEMVVLITWYLVKNKYNNSKYFIIRNLNVIKLFIGTWKLTADNLLL